MFHSACASIHCDVFWQLLVTMLPWVWAISPLQLNIGLCCSLISVDKGAIIAVEGNVDDSGFYRGSFQGKKGLVPAGFVQEMEVEDKKQRMRLLNQTLCRPHIPTLPSSPLTPLSTSRPASGSLFSPSGSMLTQTPPRLSQTAAGMQ